MNPPEGLPPHHAAAWDVLAQGGTYGEAADVAGLKPSTISAMIRKWRKAYGDDLFRDENQRRRAVQTEAAREASDRHWKNLRDTAAYNLGVTADAARERMMELLPLVGTARVDRAPDGSNPVVVTGPLAREVKDLAIAMGIAIDKAELLIGNPSTHHRRSVPQDQFFTPTAADPHDGKSDDEKRSQIIDLAARLKARKEDRAAKDAAAKAELEGNG